MIQISFEPSLDPYHTVFRMLRLLPIVGFAEKLEIDRIRIIDFYLTFPFRMVGIRLKTDHRKYRKTINDLKDEQPYGEMPEDQEFFNRMRPIQIAALQHLATRNLIDPKEFDNGWVAPTTDVLPLELNNRVESANQRDSDLMACLKILAWDYELSGSGGLKERTHLMEHRYDAA